MGSSCWDWVGSRFSESFYFLRFALEIQPTGEVSEYVATITHGTARDSKKSHHAIDSLTLTLKAEGTVVK